MYTHTHTFCMYIYTYVECKVSLYRAFHACSELLLFCFEECETYTSMERHACTRLRPHYIFLSPPSPPYLATVSVVSTPSLSAFFLYDVCSWPPASKPLTFKLYTLHQTGEKHRQRLKESERETDKEFMSGPLQRAVLPSQEFEQHAAQRKPVGAAVVRCSFLQNLRCHVAMGTSANTAINAH